MDIFPPRTKIINYVGRSEEDGVTYYTFRILDTVVSRRYKDFGKLHNHVIRLCSQLREPVELPVLPEKLFFHTEEKLNKRSEDLEIYLNQIIEVILLTGADVFVKLLMTFFKLNMLPTRFLDGIILRHEWFNQEFYRRHYA
eukprot:snap_masked-scaffold_4-processed-gene-6.6-mRNA-1 protein AED:1.00 eAED:1.00 QI:0/-1/0/0/-1/1/1/0/140